MNSPSCDKVRRIVKDEIAAGQFLHDHLPKKALQN